MKLEGIKNIIMFIEINSVKGYKSPLKALARKQASVTTEEAVMSTEHLKNWIKLNSYKIDYIKQLNKQVYRLESHAYAPELNTLVFKDGRRIKTFHAVTIEQALEQVWNTHLKTLKL